ncbi:MAG: hypothetical protein NVSMB29_01690 [Candidatus Dormibacteria bacterium]
MVVAVSLQIRDHPQISPLDEFVHADYMIKAGNGELPRAGSLVGDQMLREDACRRAELPNFQAPPCSAPVLRPEDFQGHGYNYEAGGQPPTYYFMTGVGARALVAASVTQSSVSAGRVLGILWLAVGVILLWASLAELGIAPEVRVIAIAPVIVTPAVLDAHAFITNDATAMVAGAALLLVTLRWEKARSPAWLALAIAAFAGATKLTNLLGVGAMALYLVVRALRNVATQQPAEGSVRNRWRAVGLACGMVGVGLGVGAVWSKVAAATVIPGHPTNPLEGMFHVDHLSLGHIAAQFGDVLSPVSGNPHVSPLVNHEIFSTLSFALNLLIVGGCLAAAAASPAGSRREGLGLSAFALMGAAGPVLIVLGYVSTHTAFLIPERYGLVLVPMLVVTLATLLDKALMRVLVGGFSSIAVALTLARLASG